VSEGRVGVDSDSSPAFYFDLASPEAYLSAERILHTVPVAVEWVPVLARELGPTAESWQAFRCEEDRQIALMRIERTAGERGLQPIRWPDPFPFDSSYAMLVATYAKEIGRTVQFALAAFRQAFAAGRALDVVDNVLIAASACEMHPQAILKGARTRGIQAALTDATVEAFRRGVRDVPAVWTGEQVFHGDDALDAAAGALRPRA
jgi:2-hydroxychromene-2-carboxylate isomerase